MVPLKRSGYKSVIAALLLAGVAGATQSGRPEMYFNLYRNTPRVRLLKTSVRRLSLQESDLQHQTLSSFTNGYRLRGSSFFLSNETTTELVPTAGIVRDLFPEIPEVLRLYAAFSKRGLNFVEFRFTPPLAIPDWAESLEFWSHEFLRGRKYRLAYKDASGKEYWLHFKQNKEPGWQRYSGNLTIRTAPGRPFAYRYQKLTLTRLLLLDDYARGPRKTLYHLSALAASRIRRTWDNRHEFWKYKELLRFDRRLLPLLKHRFIGINDPVFRMVKITNGFFKEALEIRGNLNRTEVTRLHIRFNKQIRIAVCRAIRLTVRGDGRLERLYILISDRLGRYYLVDFGTLNFNGWRKLEAVLPKWLNQEDNQLSGKRGIRFHEILIIPSKQRGIFKTHLQLGPLGAVYDRGINPVSLLGWPK